MNTTKTTVPLSGPGVFAPSGFFAKRKATKPAQAVYRKSCEAATPAQTARLFGVLGRGLSSHPRF